MADPTDDRLSLLLDAWASEQRLDQREANEVLQAVIQQPPSSLPATWWSELSAQVTAAVVLAAAHPGTSLDASSPSGGLAVA